MKRKGLLAMLLITVLVSLVAVLASCGGNASDKCIHVWKDVHSSEPTCEESGFVEQKCYECGATSTKTLAPLDHEPVEVLGRAPTCTEPGMSNGSNCKYCDKVIVPQDELKPTGHIIVTVEGKEATCTEKGLSDGESCSVCKAVFKEQEEIDLIDHQWIVEDGYDATCEEEGLSNRSYCSMCEEIREEHVVIPAKGHNFVSNYDGYPSTCTEVGYSDSTYCANCGLEGEERKELPLADHVLVYNGDGRPATCTENGLTESTYCESCGEVIDEQTIIEYTGHNVVSIGGKKATCRSTGSTESKQCATCKMVIAESVIIPKTGHSFENGTCSECKLSISNGLTYVKNGAGNGYIVVDKGSFEGTLVVVPDTYEGLPVVAIGEGAFKGEAITSVTLIGETTTIEKNAFEGCTSLTEVNLPKSVVSVGENAFNGCTSLDYISCEDFSQSYEWAQGWNGEANIVIKAEQKEGFSAFEIYLLAIQTMQNKIDRYKMSTTQNMSVYMNGMEMMNITNKEHYEYAVDDLYTYIYDGDSQSEMYVWYIDEVLYVIQDGIYAKMTASPEYFRDSSNQMYETLNVFEEKYFDNAEFYRNTDGTYSLVLVMSNEHMADLVERVLGMDSATVTMTSCIYSYDFDANGYLSAMYADAVFTIGDGIQSATGILDQDTILAEVGTLASVKQPVGNFIDVTNKNCTHPTNSIIIVPGFEASCTVDGLTDGAYCANCYATIKASSQIKATGHKYKNEKCTVCGKLENQSEGLYYEISDDGKTVYLAGMGTYNGTDVVVPEKMFGVPVVGIKAGAFDGANITSLSLPNTIRDIEKGTFDGCDTLKKVACPLWIVSSLPQSVEDLTITDGTSISQSDFSNLTELRILELPETITEIADGAFENSPKLTYIYNFSSLEIVAGEASYGGIAKNAIQIYTDPYQEKYIQCVGDFFFSGIEEFSLVHYIGNSEHLVLPDGINGEMYTISANVFENHNEIVSITIPENIRKMDVDAFKGCTNVKNVTTYKTTFFTTKSLPFSITEVAILGNEIFQESFKSYGNITTVTISADVTTIGWNAFLSCDSLTTVNYLGTIEDWSNITFASSYSNPVYFTKKLVIEGEEVTNLIIPDTVTEIKPYAFNNCESLTSITIGNGVTSIGTYAFDGCINVTSLTIGEGVKDIADYAFYNLKGLNELNFNAKEMNNLSSGMYGSTVNYAFYNAGKNGDGIKVTIGNTAKRVPAHLLCPSTYTDASSGLPKVASIEFEENSVCEEIGSRAFYGCSEITSIEIPATVKQIGAAAFHKSNSLTKVTFKNTEGWYCIEEDTTEPEIAITIADEATAATYLSSKYCFYNWYRE